MKNSIITRIITFIVSFIVAIILILASSYMLYVYWEAHRPQLTVKAPSRNEVLPHYAKDPIDFDPSDTYIFKEYLENLVEDIPNLPLDTDITLFAENDELEASYLYLFMLDDKGDLLRPDELEHSIPLIFRDKKATYSLSLPPILSENRSQNIDTDAPLHLGFKLHCLYTSGAEKVYAYMIKTYVN